MDCDIWHLVIADSNDYTPSPPRKCQSLKTPCDRNGAFCVRLSWNSSAISIATACLAFGVYFRCKLYRYVLAHRQLYLPEEGDLLHVVHSDRNVTFLYQMAQI